ncbi:glycosyltransferase [Caviibacterium pharyngocola]|uniref:Glycosyltransferase n=1 Tax=Caviibacterium pharyngocola TaxID=28159 RepID=A0A2M8RX95_9PAST|nr:glycosyltransferase [Caviibacterium pharyngocola]PJG83506.1 hypothetical protein CVP04_03825 [Caviibacterium pharyngocola]
MKNILILASDYPYPPNHGGRVDIFEKIKNLKLIGFNIYLISTVREAVKETDIDFMNNVVSENIILLRNRSLLSLFSINPFQIQSRKVDNLKIGKEIINIKSISFDYCLIEGHYCFGLYDLLKSKLTIKKVVLRVHNDESVYFKELALSTKNIFKKLFFYFEFIKFRIYDNKLKKRKDISLNLHISSKELDSYMDRNIGKNVFLPASIDISYILPYSVKNNKTVLFLGSLFMPNNIEGVFWYLNNIHKRLCEKYTDYNLIIAGNTKGVNLFHLNNKLSNFDNIKFVDSPKELSDLYAKSCVFINPMLSGAGVKLKTINAIQNGLPVVSTSVGNEGTGLKPEKDILVSDVPELFFQNVCRLLDDEDSRAALTNSAQGFIRNNYNQVNNLREILK